tara:strand:- start:15500 stop:15835 length:336 start_codon:yes stop_codon:yes gene_type:complete
MIKTLEEMQPYEYQPVMLWDNGKVEHSARVCSVCDDGMLSGYVLFDGQDYACTDECLYKLKDHKGNLWTLESFSDYYEEYEDGNSDCYWTDWYECDEYECHICEAIIGEEE